MKPQQAADERFRQNEQPVAAANVNQLMARDGFAACQGQLQHSHLRQQDRRLAAKRRSPDPGTESLAYQWTIGDEKGTGEGSVRACWRYRRRRQSGL